MSVMGRVRCVTSGWTGGPGLTTFYFSGATTGAWDNTDASGAVSAVGTFWTSIKALFPVSFNVNVGSQVDELDPLTGALVGTSTASTSPQITGTGSAIGPTAAGALVRWQTGVTVNRRMLRGRTFLVPIAASSFTADGGIVSTTQTTISNAAQALVADAGSQLLVWHRPSGPKGSQTGGAVSPAISGACSSRQAILRSRRD